MAAVATEQVIYEYLKASGSGLFTLCGDRIRQFVARKSDDNTTPFVVFRNSGGLSSRSNPTANPRFDFLCYGGSLIWQDAWSVERALKDLLHQATNKTVASGIIRAAFQTNEGQQQMDNDEWPFIITTYDVAVKPTA